MDGPSAAAGATALPFDPYTPFLEQDNEIRDTHRAVVLQCLRNPLTALTGQHPYHLSPRSGCDPNNRISTFRMQPQQ